MDENPYESPQVPATKAFPSSYQGKRWVIAVAAAAGGSGGWILAVIQELDVPRNLRCGNTVF